MRVVDSMDRAGSLWGSASDPSLNGGSDPVDRALDTVVSQQEVLDLLDGVDDGRMVLVSEDGADVGEGLVGHLSGEENGDLARDGIGAGAAGGHQFGYLDLEELADDLLDLGDGDGGGSGEKAVLEGLLGEGEVYLVMGERGESDETWGVAAVL